MARTAPPIQKALQSLFHAVENLESVYESENDALKNTDTQRFLSLQDSKAKHAEDYQLCIEAVLARKDELKNLDNPLKQKLRNVQARFSNTAQRNLEAIARMQRTTKRLNDTIRLAARDAINKKQALQYSEYGRLENQSKRLVTTGISETA